MAPDGTGKVDQPERQPRRQPGVVARRHEARVHAARQGEQRRRLRRELERQGAAERDQDVARRREPRLDSGRLEDHVRRRRDADLRGESDGTGWPGSSPAALSPPGRRRPGRLHRDGRAVQLGDLRRERRRQRRAERDERAELRRRLGSVVAGRHEDCLPRFFGSAGEIFVMNADGTGQADLTNDPSNDLDPTWSPDGSKIAFTTNRGPTGDNEIYVMNADGTNPADLTNSPANESDPDWQPVPGAARSQARSGSARSRTCSGRRSRQRARCSARRAVSPALSGTRARSARAAASSARRHARVCGFASASA